MVESAIRGRPFGCSQGKVARVQSGSPLGALTKFSESSHKDCERNVGGETQRQGGFEVVHDSPSAAPVSQEKQQLYEFGPFLLDPAEHKLLRGNQIVPLTPKALDTLLLLVRNSGHLLEKDEIIRTLWADSFVE